MKDPFDILLSYEPVDMAEIELYANTHAEGVKQQILASPRVVDGVVEGHRERRPMRRIAAVAASVAVLAAAAFVVTRAVSDTDAMACYGAVDLEADRVGLQPAELDVAACAELWEDGSLVNKAIIPAGEIPPLTGCVDDDGTLRVFPTADAGECGRLGLAVYEGSAPQNVDSIVMVQERLRLFVAGNACVALSDLAAEARSQLAAEGLTDWAVVEGAPTSGRTCASFAVDDGTMTILIVPVPEA